MTEDLQNAQAAQSEPAQSKPNLFNELRDQAEPNLFDGLRDQAEEEEKNRVHITQFIATVGEEIEELDIPAELKQKLHILPQVTEHMWQVVAQYVTARQQLEQLLQIRIVHNPEPAAEPTPV